MEQWYKLEADDVLKKLGSSPGGLSSGQISSLQQKFGKNVLEETKRKSRIEIFLRQFSDVMIIILIAAAIISFFVGDFTDGLVILAIIIANALIGYFQEYNAEKAVQMLQKMAAQFAMVIRDDEPLKLKASELVPGDIISLNAGDIVPADARLIRVSALKTEEAPLTGESHSVDKIVKTIQQEKVLPGDQLNMVFKGTLVSNGSATAVVTGTGMNTEIGKIAGMLETGVQKTPLQKRLGLFTKQLSVIVILICLLVFGLGLLRGEPTLIMFLTALSLAVAALPEALPAVITIALSKGARRMARQQALVRKLPAVETLGSVTYICSDKTGTLTQNVMTVQETKFIEGKEGLLWNAMISNNEVQFTDDGKTFGDSTEIAMVKYSITKGLSPELSKKEFPLKTLLPFDSERMRMSTIHKYENKWIIFTKGAPGKMAEALAPEYEQESRQWLELNREWAADGLRVLMFAYKILDTIPEKPDEKMEAGLQPLGMVGMIDPPREEMIDAIQECRSAGIRTLMITGDQPLTAAAIAGKLKMTDGKPRAITGAEMIEMGPDELKKEIDQITVFARVSPGQKVDIVKALQDNGEFVAMTGDGVNDAPSLKQADIGIAMGITGTDVSKEAADMILLDDNFATIVKAVKTGRRIYDNIRKFILYVLACNLAEILTIFTAPFFGLSIPLLPIHILWINLVTDGLPGLAMSNEPAEKDIMKRPPRPPNESLFGQGMIPRILSTGTLMAAIALLMQAWAVQQGYDVLTQQTMVFTLLCFAQLANALSVRSNELVLFSGSFFANRGLWGAVILTFLLQMAIVYIPSLHPVFKTTTLEWALMSKVLIATLACLLGYELIKLLNRRKTN